jgi:hypothetical protein
VTDFEVAGSNGDWPTGANVASKVPVKRGARRTALS